MSSIHSSQLANDICLFTLDMPGKSANVLTDQVYADLNEAISQLESNPPRGLILVSAKPGIYVAGADLVKISSNLDWPDDKIHAFCDHGRGIMSRFSQMPTVSVAAIHGVCVGGGLELTLWCDQRIAADHRRTLLGLPEVKLGLVPGWAGTVLLPRMIGLEPAVRLATSGDLVGAAESLSLGMVSQVVPQEELVDSAVQLIESELESGAYLERRRSSRGPVTNMPESTESLRRETIEAIHNNHDVGPSAATQVLDHMIDSAGKSLAEACESEKSVFASVWGSAENRGLLHYFFLDERAKKTRPQYPDGQAPELGTVGIVGAGLMGSRIARLSLAAGLKLRVFDADERRIKALVDDLVAGNESYRDQVTAIDGLAGLAGCDLVVEAIVEKLSVKRSLFERVCKIVGPQTFLATNTSTIPVSDIADALNHPERLVGLHFCCPVEPMRLVEIIAGPETSELTTNVAIDFVRRMRKTPVVVGDHPGFVVNRMLAPFFNHALELLQHNIDPRRIDQVMRDFGFAVGPLEMIDFIGVDTIMYGGETFLRTLPDLIILNPILPALVKRNRNGRKVNLGFYRYASFDAPPEFDPELTTILDKYQRDPITIGDEEIQERLLGPMAAESQKILDDEEVHDSRDIDLCSILGTTFPKAKGGILFWANELRPVRAD